MEHFNAKRFRRAGILVVNDTIRRLVSRVRLLFAAARDCFSQKRDAIEVGSLIKWDSI
jgi:hypothetical protein